MVRAVVDVAFGMQLLPQDLATVQDMRALLKTI